MSVCMFVCLLGCNFFRPQLHRGKIFWQQIWLDQNYPPSHPSPPLPLLPSHPPIPSHPSHPPTPFPSAPSAHPHRLPRHPLEGGEGGGPTPAPTPTLPPTGGWEEGGVWLGHLHSHFDHFAEFIDASFGKIWRPYIHFPGSYGHFKNYFLVHFYTFYNFKMAITPKLR